MTISFRERRRKDRDERRRPVNLEDLYDRYGEMLYRFLLVRLGSPADAEDVLQETFCRFARYAVRWKLVRDPKMFVFRVARNEANRFLRGRIRSSKGASANPEEPTGFAAAFESPKEEAAVLILTGLDKLPGEQREVIQLKIFEGLTFKEISAICGISANTAASRYRYGIDRLRAVLKGGE